MAFIIQSDDSTLGVSMDFWRSRISEKHGKVIMEAFQEALSCVLVSPDRLVRDMIFTPQTHLSQILKWNQQIPPTTDACVHDLVSVTAHQQPKALAVDA